jgi:indolepyruvate ferredoxin oxidoreductase beta subunit
MSNVTSVVIGGIGGQGVLKASAILSEAVFRAGYDVKQSEVHGMSQRGGSVISEVRFGDEVFSPMTPVGGADYLVILQDDQVETNRHLLKDDGALIVPEEVDVKSLPDRRALNVALIALLAKRLEIDEPTWIEALRASLPSKVQAMNEGVFREYYEG